MTETGHHSRIRQVEAISHGTVIDHLPTGVTLKVAQLLGGGESQLFIGVNLRSSRQGRKGVLKIAGRELGERDLSVLALIAPEATVSIIRDYAVVEKRPIPLPPHFDDIAACANPNCITNHERVPTHFAVVGRQPLRVRCRYCERTFAGGDLTVK